LEKGPPEAGPAFPAPPQFAAHDALDPAPLGSLDFCEALSDPDTESFGSLLEEKLQHTLEDKSGRNLLDSVRGIAEEQIYDQSRSYGYDGHEISLAFRFWS
jgi:hypothetical protein